MPTFRKPGPLAQQQAGKVSAPVEEGASPRPTSSMAAAGVGQSSASSCQDAWKVRLPVLEGPAERRRFCSISVELEDACGLPEFPGAYPSNWRQVLSWLRRKQDVIVEAEKTWSVDRRAIAGAIAWEALENGGLISNWIRRNANFHLYGPGKVHPQEPSRDSIAEEVEKAGYLAIRNTPDRNQSLHTVQGAVDYVAAIMRACADIVTTMGGYPPDQTYWNPPILATWYQSKYLSELKVRYATRKYPAPLDPGEIEMGQWVRKNVRYLEDAVGKLPDNCRPNIVPMPGVRLARALKPSK